MANLFSKNSFISIVKGFHIVPENNIVSMDKLKEIEKTIFFQNQTKAGNYIITKDSLDKKPIKKSDKDKNPKQRSFEHISKLSPTEAISIIKGDGQGSQGLLDIEILKMLKENDNRTGVVKAAEDQIKILFSRDDK